MWFLKSTGDLLWNEFCARTSLSCGSVECCRTGNMRSTLSGGGQGGGVASFQDGSGCAAMWHATFQKPEGGETVEADGMDLVIVEDGLVKRNEVYFDRAVLASLL